MFKWITDIIATLGYAGVAALTFLENVFPPIPSELILPLAGFVAAQGTLRLDLVIVAGTVGSLAGALFWYEIGRRVGEVRLRRWVRRHGKWLTLSVRELDAARAWFERHDRAAVLIGRMVPGVRTFVSLPAGFTAMPLVPFLVYSTIGTLVWTALLAGSGLLLQASYARVAGYVDIATDVLLAGLVLLLVRRYVICWRDAAACGDE